MTPDSEHPPISLPPDSPLDAGQMGELVAAVDRSRRLLRAGRAAAFTGGSLLVFGALSILVSVLSPPGVLVGGALLFLGWNELEGRKLLLRFQPQGPRRLAHNQLWLLAVIVAYCGWAIYRTRTAPSASVTEMETLLGLGEGFVSDATAAAYALVMAVGAAFQWGMYRFHLARIALLQDYVKETPPWVVEVLRSVRGS
jgi:hypothetical protein